MTTIMEIIILFCIVPSTSRSERTKKLQASEFVFCLIKRVKKSLHHLQILLYITNMPRKLALNVISLYSWHNCHSAQLLFLFISSFIHH